MIQIALADNCPLIRRALQELFANTTEYRLAWDVSIPSDLFQALARKRPHVLILDPALSANGASLRLIQQVRAQHPRVPLLVYTAGVHQDIAVTAMQLGAAGFLVKDASENELFVAIKRLAGGKRYLNPSLMEHLALLRLSDDGNHHKTALSPREQQVLEGLASGLPLIVIGQNLGCSAKTVSTHRARLLQKLGLHSNVELLRYIQNTALLRSSASA